MHEEHESCELAGLLQRLLLNVEAKMLAGVLQKRFLLHGKKKLGQVLQTVLGSSWTFGPPPSKMLLQVLLFSHEGSGCIARTSTHLGIIPDPRHTRNAL